MPIDRILEIPEGMSLETLLWGGDAHADAPLNLEAFDTLADDADAVKNLQWLCQWAEPQSTCDAIIKHHGTEGCNRVLKGIAQACSKHKQHMGKRVAAVAGFYEMDVY
jgi:hypothetical protein